MEKSYELYLWADISQILAEPLVWARASKEAWLTTSSEFLVFKDFESLIHS
jgi:hypothetical protein